MVGKRELIGVVDDVPSYTVLHNSKNVLCRGSSGSNVVKGVGFIGKEVKGYVHRYFKMMRKCIDPALHAWVVIERIVVEVAKFRGISL